MFRRAVRALVAACLAVPLVLTVAPEVAQADELRMTSTTTYTLDAETGVVHVVVDISFRNTYYCSSLGGYYYAGFYLPIPIGTSTATATTSGRSLKITSEALPDTDDYLLLDISFLSRLHCQSSTRVTVSYDLLGNAPRAQNTSRINSAYAGFLAFGVGDTATISVIIPPSYTSETFGDDVDVSYDNGNTVYSATDVKDPYEFEFFVSASNNDALVESDVTTEDGVEFRIQGWPGDSEWMTFITEQVEVGVPLLTELIGQPWPIDEPVDIRESHTPYLYGYAGWFSAGTNELEIGEDLDADTALHELSHAWFNDAWLTERWISEGFAQLFASRGVEELGGSGLQPQGILATDPGKVRLNDWGDPSFSNDDQEIDDVEAFGYNAAFFVIDQIADELGDDRLREVLDAVANDTTAYRGDIPPESNVSATNWRRFLDLIEEVGGATTAVELYEDYIVSKGEAPSLVERTAARDEYHELVADGGEWAPPVVVREEMAEWDFDEATELIAAAAEVIALRDELDTKTTELATDYPSELEQTYESADEDLDDAKAAVLEQIESADALLAAAEAEGKDDGLFGTLGLIGSDPAATLDDAKAAFAAGDQDLARDLAQDVKDQVAEAPGTGKTRALIAGAVLLVIALGVFFLVRRSRRRRQSAPLADSPAETLDASEAPAAVTPQ